MIFVTVGTNEAPFDRLLGAIERIDTDEPILAQCGPAGVRPANAECVDFLPYDELVSALRRAGQVVTHAGVGTVLTALSVGLRPVVVPRLRQYGEAVDDHQLPFARRMQEIGLITLVEDIAELGAALTGDQRVASVRVRAEPALVEELRAFVAAAR